MVIRIARPSAIGTDIHTPFIAPIEVIAVVPPYRLNDRLISASVTFVPTVETKDAKPIVTL